MWTINKPSEERLRALLAAHCNLDVSYESVGATEKDAPPGFVLDHNRIELGSGADVFADACESLRAWRQFPPGWTEIYPSDTPIEPGQQVAMLAHSMGVWWLNACRIVYVVDETHPVRRFGFAYGTLPAHVECGEERFTIEQDAEERVWYDIRAFSRPRYLPARIMNPVVRRLQRRFVRDSQAAMRAMVAGRNPTDAGEESK
jgi:uncharacterized protein (UPF0548 family)